MEKTVGRQGRDGPRAPDDIPTGLEREVIGFLARALDLERIERVLDVGSGSGSFARWLAGVLRPDGCVYGIDYDVVAVRNAKCVSFWDLSADLGFLAASADRLPLASSCADLVICRKLLCVLDRVDTAIREMCRVLKPEGMFVAIEPAGPRLFYDPEEEEYAALCREVDEAFYQGWRRLGMDQRVGIKVPALLLRHGLAEVTAEGISQVYLLGDPRRPRGEVLAQLRTEAARHAPRTLRLLYQGGISPQNVVEHQRLARRRLSRFTADPSAITQSGYMRMTTFVVAFGTKPA